MNTNSQICRFIAAHPADWETRLYKDYGIRVKREDGGYAIFNYGIGCDYADGVVQEARGIIVDTERLEVVCWPFRKFGNHNEGYADPIDWSTARVQEKVDGSIVKLWYDARREKWQFSTNGLIRAENAPVEQYEGLFFGDLIRRADNYGDIPFETLDRSTTYIFELVSPETQIVVPYGCTTLYHIGTRSNLTGEERRADIGIRKPASYALRSLEDCLRAAAMLNAGPDGAPAGISAEITQEGFVVVDGNWHRVKVKSPDYIVKHRLSQKKSISKRDCLRLLLEDPKTAEETAASSPMIAHIFKYYDFRLAELRYTADRFAELTRGLYREYDGNRRTVSEIISKHPLARIGFRALETDCAGSELLPSLRFESIVKLIPDYEPEDLRALFRPAAPHRKPGAGNKPFE